MKNGTFFFAAPEMATLTYFKLNRFKHICFLGIILLYFT